MYLHLFGFYRRPPAHAFPTHFDGDPHDWMLHRLSRPYCVVANCQIAVLFEYGRHILNCLRRRGCDHGICFRRRYEEVANRLDNPPTPPYHSLFHTNGLATAFGLVAYCFSGHAIIPSIYSSMQKPQEFEKVVDFSFLVVMGCCLAVGLSGYSMFGNLVFDQVTISLEQNSSAALAMTILAYLMVLTAFSKLTLTMFPLAIGMEELVAPFLTSDQAMELASGLIKFILLALALAVAIYVPSFSFLCSLVGMICTMTVSVIFPAAAYLKLFGHKLGFLEKLMYWSFVVAGFVMAVVGTMFGL